jgi:flagellin
MALTVRNNTAVQAALGHLSRTNRGLSRSFERISSGYRIARAADDAAGLAVAENLKAAYISARAAAHNIVDGLGVISVAEGASIEVAAILIRLRELAVQSSSETLANAERAYIDDEADSLVAEISGLQPLLSSTGLF